MNVKILIIVGLVLLTALYFLRRRERYEEPMPTVPEPTPTVPEPTPSANPALERLKTEIQNCHGDSECVRKVMVNSVRSGYEKKIVAPVNEAS